MPHVDACQFTHLGIIRNRFRQAFFSRTYVFSSDSQAFPGSISPCGIGPLKPTDIHNFNCHNRTEVAYLTELDHPIDLSGWSKYNAFVQIVKEVLASDNFCFQVTSH